MYFKKLVGGRPTGSGIVAVIVGRARTYTTKTPYTQTEQPIIRDAHSYERTARRPTPPSSAA